MPERYRCRVERATIRPEQEESLRDLVRKMFERRHHHRVGGPETDWLAVELVQSLRKESVVYREELSTETDGPLPFALGYFRVRDGRLETVSDQVPANVKPRVIARFLSEFLEPGAQLWFADATEEHGWEVQDVGVVAALPDGDNTGDPHPEDSGASN